MNRSFDSRKISSNLTYGYVTRVQHVCAVGVSEVEEREQNTYLRKYPNLMKTRN